MTTVSDKQLGEFVQSVFVRPFSRRCPFLYLGLDLPAGIYAVGDVADNDDRLQFNNPEDCFGLVYLRSQDYLELFNLFCDKFRIPRGMFGTIYINEIATYGNRVKWDLSALKILRSPETGYMYISQDENTNILIYRPLEAFYMFTNFGETAIDTYKGCFTDEHPHLECVVPDHIVKLQTGQIVISEDELSGYTLGHIPHGLKLTLVKGRDFISIPKAPKKDTTSQSVWLRIWRYSNSTLAKYATGYHTQEYSVVNRRPNGFVHTPVKDKGCD